MAENKIQNYTLMEIMHLSYLLRDSLEYCHPQINVTQEAFDRRTAMAKNMLSEGNFIEKWLNNHPNEEVKKVYPQLVAYFENIYQNEAYVSFETKKVDSEKVVDFAEETIKLYQVAEDISRAFYNEYKKTPDLVDERIEKCLLASYDYYRVICNWLLFNEVMKNDAEYKKALKASGNKPSYEVNYNLNVLKRLIAAYNFNKQRYVGDKMDIKHMLEASMIAFKSLDGTLVKEQEEKTGKKLTAEEIEELTKKSIGEAVTSCVNAIRLYEPIWRQTYSDAIKYMQENPMKAAPAQEGNA